MATRLDELRRELKALGVTDVDDESEEWCAGYLPTARQLASQRAGGRQDAASTKATRGTLQYRTDAAYAASFGLRIDELKSKPMTAEEWHASQGTAAAASKAAGKEKGRRTSASRDVYAEAYALSFRNGGRP